MMEPWFNPEAEQLNAYIHAYCRHNKNVISPDIYRQLIQGNREAFYDNKLLHPNQEKSAPPMNDLINLAVEFYMQDNQILTSSRLTSLQAEDNYFRSTNIWDYHNICRRNFQKLMKKGVKDPVAIRQQIKIDEARQTDEPLPDVWTKSMTNVPPYVAEYETND